MKTYEEISKDEVGTIYHDSFEDGVRFIVTRGPSALCAYLGVPIAHPLAGMEYDNMPIQCHGGLTFSDEGDGTYRPKGYWWYGWDYAHCDDYAFYYLNEPRLSGDGKKWIVDDVIKDSWKAKYDMRGLVKVAERIAWNAVKQGEEEDG